MNKDFRQLAYLFKQMLQHFTEVLFFAPPYTIKCLCKWIQNTDFPYAEFSASVRSSTTPTREIFLCLGLFHAINRPTTSLTLVPYLAASCQIPNPGFQRICVVVSSIPFHLRKCSRTIFSCTLTVTYRNETSTTSF